MDKFVTPCSSSCAKKNQEFTDRIYSLEQKVSILTQQVSELEEIREEMLMEIRGYPIQSENADANEPEPVNLPYAMENPLNDSGQFSYRINVEEQDVHKLSFGDDTGSQDEVNDEFDSRSSTPCLVIDEDIPLDLSSSEKNPLCSFDESTDLKAETCTDEHPLKTQIDGDWTSLDEKAVSTYDTSNRAEQDDQLVETSEPEVKRRKVSSGDVNAISPVDVLPGSPLVCPQCSTEKVFATKGGLTRHIKTFHSEERPLFQCGECDRAFVYKEGIKYHISSVHEGIRFLCDAPECGSLYTRITALRQHQKKVGHGIGSITVRINEVGTS